MKLKITLKVVKYKFQSSEVHQTLLNLIFHELSFFILSHECYQVTKFKSKGSIAELSSIFSSILLLTKSFSHHHHQATFSSLHRIQLLYRISVQWMIHGDTYNNFFVEQTTTPNKSWIFLWLYNKTTFSVR